MSGLRTPKACKSYSVNEGNRRTFPEGYQRYLDWLVAAGVLKARVDARDIVTNALIGPINDKLDLKAVETALAK